MTALLSGTVIVMLMLWSALRSDSGAR